MELSDAIRMRRSIRAFDGRPVDRAIIERLVDAATYAPSRFNVQPWHFHIATGDARRRIAEVMAMSTTYVEEYLEVLGPEVVEYAAKFYADLGSAPVVVAISAHKADDPTEWADVTISVGAALENFLLAVVDEGLAACTLTAPHWVRDRLIGAFEIPEGSDLMAIVVVGYGTEIPREKDRNADIVTYLT